MLIFVTFLGTGRDKLRPLLVALLLASGTCSICGATEPASGQPVQTSTPSKCRVQIIDGTSHYYDNHQAEYAFPNDIKAEFTNLLNAKGYTLVTVPRRDESGVSYFGRSESDLVDYRLEIKFQVGTNVPSYYLDLNDVSLEVRLKRENPSDLIFFYASKGKNIDCVPFRSLDYYYNEDVNGGIFGYIQGTYRTIMAWNNRCDNGEERFVFLQHRMHKILRRMLPNIPTCELAATAKRVDDSKRN